MTAFCRSSLFCVPKDSLRIFLYIDMKAAWYQWVLSSFLQQLTPLFQFFADILRIRKPIKPSLIKFMKAVCLKGISSLIVRGEYLSLSRTGHDQTKIPLASVSSQNPKTVCAADVILPFFADQELIRVSFIRILGKRMAFHIFRHHRPRYKRRFQAALICLLKIAVRLASKGSLKWHNPIIWPRSSISDLGDKLEVILWKRKMIRFFHQADNRRIEWRIQLILMLGCAKQLAILINAACLLQYRYYFFIT